MVKFENKEQEHALIDLIISLEYMSTWCDRDIYKQYNEALDRVKKAFKYE